MAKDELDLCVREAACGQVSEHLMAEKMGVPTSHACPL